ncbi:hypothetical protein F5Y15DRAFT_397523 [Xylariaceae sp. FL0016]|nr:hypothetical protein F5Y15DRAFT_397523 [Xylariaceae sp. FL0016]
MFPLSLCAAVHIRVAASIHGWMQSGSWTIIVIFGLLRIIGAGFQLVTINKPDNRAAYAGALGRESIGIAPHVGMNVGNVSAPVSSIQDCSLCVHASPGDPAGDPSSDLGYLDMF